MAATPQPLGANWLNNTGPLDTARPSKSPPPVHTAFTAVAKAPPEGALRWLQQREPKEQPPDLLDWLSESEQEGATTGQAQPGAPSRGTPEQENLADKYTGAQGEESSLGRTAQATPDTAPQSTAGANCPRHQVERKPAPANSWADFEYTHNQASNTPNTAPSAPHRTADIRMMPTAPRLQHRTFPRRQLWASKHFDTPPTDEMDFLRRWLKALRDHD